MARAGEKVIRIRNQNAALHVALEGAGALDTGDGVRLTGTGEQRVTATEAAEIRVWEMHATLAA